MFPSTRGSLNELDTCVVQGPIPDDANPGRAPAASEKGDGDRSPSPFRLDGTTSPYWAAGRTSTGRPSASSCGRTTAASPTTTQTNWSGLMT